MTIRERRWLRRDTPRMGLLFGLILLALWLPRGLALDRFVTVDEPKWLLRSANFYNALVRGNLKDTFQREHPGVTITWAGTAGFFWRFPGYYKISPEQNMTPTRFHNFLSSHGRSSLDLLVAGRTFVALGIVAALGAAFLVTCRLLGLLPALLAFLLIAFDPFQVGLSRLLHLDGLVSALMTLSILAFAGYLYLGRRMGYLLLSGVAGGLAWLTKSPAFFLGPFVGLMLLVEWLKVGRFKVEGWKIHKATQTPEEASRGRSAETVISEIWHAFSPLLMWFGVAAAAFVLLWPAMWVDPLGSLSKVFSQATAYASEGHEIPTYFYGDVYLGGESPWYFYPVVYLWRLTPSTLFGLVLAGLSLVFPRWLPAERDRRRLMQVLLLFSVLFTLFMSLGAKKFDRYLLPVFAPLNVVAALGWLALERPIRHYAMRISSAYYRAAFAMLMGVVVLGQLFGTFQTYPYYLNFYNPMLGGVRKAAQVMMVGWGEGLDQAARYLNTLPRTNKERAIAWYGDGCFSYFFDGATVPIGLDFTLADLRGTDFVVLYLNQWQRGLPSAEFMAYFEQLKTSYVVNINGVDYVRVYNLREIP